MPRSRRADPTALAMQAARLRRDTGCDLQDAVAEVFGDMSGYESAKSASELLDSGMWRLVRAVNCGALKIGTATEQRIAAVRKGIPPKDVEPDLADYLYLITEPNGRLGKVGVASKIGVDGPRARFNEAQRGNPRKLRVAGLWRFTQDGQAEVAERAVLRHFEPTAGGKEWRRGITIEDVNRIAEAGGGQRMPVPPGLRGTYETRPPSDFKRIPQ